jgi:hypothetical protein
MCVTFCHKRHLLFFTHEDCSLLQCRFADPDRWGSCHDCPHNQEDRCGLTNAPTPVSGGGCCHWGTPLVTAQQVIGVEQVTLLPAFGRDQTVADILDGYGVAYEAVDGRVLVEPDEMPLPLVYGRGTDPAEDLFGFETASGDGAEIVAVW